MGYYTDYTLSVENADGKEEDIEGRIQDISGYTDLSFEGVHNCRWYNCFKDMEAVSLEFPDVTFYVEGEGEEQGDMWKAILKNGKSKVEKPQIVWPELKLD